MPATQNRLNKFLNAIPLNISVHDAKGQIIYTNQVAQQLLNIQDLAKAEIEQLSKTYHIYRVGTGEMYPVEQRPLVRSLGGEKAQADDLELHHSDAIVFVEATSTAIFDETGAVEYAIAAFQDISDRKQAEITLIENVRLEQEISDRKKTEAELELAKEAAVAANLTKSTFLANMSHELRTPLNVILGFSQLMNQDTNGCDDFVRKPFHTKAIFDIMAKHLGVGYIYQDRELPSHSSKVTGEPLNLTNLLAAMSKKMDSKII